MLVLTHARLELGWSKSELSRRAKMSASEVGKIESGRLKPYPSQLRKLARALRIRVADASLLLEEIGDRCGGNGQESGSGAELVEQRGADQ